MHSEYTAIIHLRDPKVVLDARAIFEPMLRIIRGVDGVQFDPVESLVMVHYDGDQASLAEIVRVIEDTGTQVTGVAQRHSKLRKAG